MHCALQLGAGGRWAVPARVPARRGVGGGGGVPGGRAAAAGRRAGARGGGAAAAGEGEKEQMLHPTYARA